MAMITISLVTLLSYLILRSLFHRFTFTQKVNKIPGFLPSSLGLGIRSTITLIRMYGSIARDKYPARMAQFVTGFPYLFPDKGILRIWAGPYPFVMIWKPELVQEFMTKYKDETRKSMVYKFLRPFLGNGLVTSHGEVWKNHRKLLTPAFHFKILEHAVHVMNKSASILVNKLNDLIKNEDDCGIIDDIAKPVLLCSLDIISESAMGQEIRAQDGPGTYDLMKFCEMINCGFMTRTMIPWLYPDFMFNLSKLGRAFNHMVREVKAIIGHVIKVKQLELHDNGDDQDIGSEKAPAFMDVMIKLHQESPDELTLDDLKDQVMTFMTAGSETTGWTVAWAIHCLSLDMEIQRRLHEELDREIPNPGQDLTFDQLKQGLPFTEAVVKETLRLYATIPLITRQLDHDIVIGGYEIPASVNIGVSLFGVHRDPDHWPQPNKFIPDRFFQNNHSQHPFAFIPFSAGARNCIGQKYAMMETKLLLAKIFRKFRITAVDPNAVVEGQFGITHSACSDIRVRLEVRE